MKVNSLQFPFPFIMRRLGEMKYSHFLGNFLLFQKTIGHRFNHIPGCTDVPLFGRALADDHAQREFTPQRGMGEVELARGVEPVHERFI